VTPARIIIEPAAKQDVLAARNYYATKSDSASDSFREELIQVLDLLSRHPESCAIAFGRTRLKPIRQFPYVIGYIFHNRVVHVTGVQHGGLGWEEFHRRQF
jgi:plasmid stabilization system protein ParE